MIDASLIAPLRIRPLHRAEYDRLVELGVFQDERLELLRGTLVEMTPQGTAHAEALRRLTRIFVRALGDRAVVQIQSPFAASEDSEPEPDVAILPPGDYSRAHPASALLIIEVSGDSLRKDRKVKSGVYAEANVPEYWIVDLEGRRVEIHRAPSNGAYTQVRAATDVEEIAPDAFNDIRIHVAELLP